MRIGISLLYSGVSVTTTGYSPIFLSFSLQKETPGECFLSLKLVGSTGFWDVTEDISLTSVESSISSEDLRATLVTNSGVTNACRTLERSVFLVINQGWVPVPFLLTGPTLL